jgi:hypothetical protein
VSSQLVLSVVFSSAVGGHRAFVGSVLYMASFVVVSIPDSGKLFRTEIALVGSHSGVDPLVNLEVASLVESLVAEDWASLRLVLAHIPLTYEGLLEFSATLGLA